MKTIRDFDITNKNVVIRCDFNVPMKEGKIVDDTRIKGALETIRYALSKNAKVILLSHLGKVKEESDKEKNTLLPVSTCLEKLLGQKVYFIHETDFEKVEKQVADLKNGEVCLLENTRFYDLDGKKESGNSEELAQFYARLGDIFINDAFGTMHRAHASNVGITNYLPSGIGFLVEKEIKAISSVFCPERPFIVILGGAKVKDKIGVIEKFAAKCDKILMGGAMALTFLKAEGYEIGASTSDDESLDFCKKMLSKYQDKLVLPVDLGTSKTFEEGTPIYKDITELDFDDYALDIGPQTVENFKNQLASAKTVLWNGPLGLYEFPSYQKGTKEILFFLKDKKEEIQAVIGGGDTVACAMENHLEKEIYHLSTGGGATLKYLENETLEGFEAIQKNESH